MKKKIFGGIAVLAVSTVATFSVLSSTGKPATYALISGNVEAIARGEELPGKECRYPGSSSYGDWIPCTAQYPNIGKCGERKNQSYSSDKGQCYE